MGSRHPRPYLRRRSPRIASNMISARDSLGRGSIPLFSLSGIHHATVYTIYVTTAYRAGVLTPEPHSGACGGYRSRPRYSPKGPPGAAPPGCRHYRPCSCLHAWPCRDVPNNGAGRRERFSVNPSLRRIRSRPSGVRLGTHVHTENRVFHFHRHLRVDPLLRELRASRSIRCFAASSSNRKL